MKLLSRTIEVSCELCGGPGAMRVKDSLSLWVENAHAFHRDPRVCKSFLNQHAMETPKTIKQIADDERAIGRKYLQAYVARVEQELRAHEVHS